MNVDSGIELDDLWGIVRRRGKLAAIVAGVTALAAYWVAMALPNEYGSYATVLVEPQAISPELVQAGVKESDLTDRLHIMTAQILSRPRLSRIIDETALYEDEHESMLRQEVIDLMRERISVEPVIPELEQTGPVRRGDIEINQFRIHFMDEDAVVARDVAQRLANDFIERHIEQRVEVSQKSLDFVETELKRLAERIAEVEARIAAVKAANPGRRPEDATANQNQMARLNQELALAQRNLGVAQSDVAFYRSQASAAASITAAASDDDLSPARRLERLELALAEYKARGFTEKHPDVTRTQLEIVEMRERVRRIEDDEEAGRSPSFAVQNLEAEADRASLRVGSAQQEIARLEESINEVQARIAETPAVAEQLDALEREYRHLFNSYQDFSKRRQDATVKAQLERRQLGEQLRVLESAFIAPEPASPNRPLIVIIGLLFGLVLGAGAAVLLEGTDSSVHTARQVQVAANLPVLASIPQIWLESDRAAQRRRRMRELLATAAVVLFALVGGAANYAWVNGMPGFLAGDAVEEGETGSDAAGPADEG